LASQKIRFFLTWLREMVDDAIAPGALPEDHDVVAVATECGDVGLHPPHGLTLQSTRAQAHSE
jgi:hypothetical protein